MPGWCSRPAAPGRSARESAPGPAAMARAQWGEQRASNANDLQTTADSWRNDEATATIVVPDPARTGVRVLTLRSVRTAPWRRLPSMPRPGFLTTERRQPAYCAEVGRRSGRSGPSDLARFRKQASARCKSPPRSAWPRPESRRRSSSSTASGCGSSRPPSNRRPRSRSPGIKPVDSSVHWSSISAPASAAMHWHWPLDSERPGRRSRSGNVPSTPLQRLGLQRRRSHSRRSCTSRDIRDPRRGLAASRSGPPGERSRACSIARGLRSRARFLEVGRAASRRRGDQARTGQRFREALRRPGIRGRADQSRAASARRRRSGSASSFRAAAGRPGFPRMSPGPTATGRRGNGLPSVGWAR